MYYTIYIIICTGENVWWVCSTILDFGPRFVPVNVILQQFYGGHSVYNSLREEIFAELYFMVIVFKKKAI